MKRLFSLLFIFLLLYSCLKNDSIETPSPNHFGEGAEEHILSAGYKIGRYVYSSYIDAEYIQLSDMEDKDKEYRINEFLLERLTSWTEKPVRYDEANLDVLLSAERYLSLMLLLVQRDGRTYLTEINITIDIRSGKEVFLDDLVDIKALALKIYNEKVAKTALNYSDGKDIEDANNDVQGFLGSELERIEEILYNSSREKAPNWPDGPGFSLKEGYLFFFVSHAPYFNFQISVEDIEDILLVDKW